ncbi:MAG: hypothetical protein KBA08_03900 [Firmicutes bacterium]|nr:hypothetical protein [Bacillota bacterium]
MLIAYVSIFWDAIILDVPFTICFLIIFVLVWTLAASKFEKKKIKAAMSVVNALTLTILALTFIAYFGISTIVFVDTNTINEIKAEGYTIETMIEILIKAITLPYLLGGIWGLVALDIRDAKE